MERYQVWYTMEGMVEFEAESEEEAREQFDDLSESELWKNTFDGAQITNIR